jgi:hypothetical protein
MRAYSPARQTTDSMGQPYDEITCIENLKSGGLRSVMVEKSSGIDYAPWKTAKLDKLLNNRFSLVAYKLKEDYNVPLDTEIKFTSATGWKCLRYKNIEYREHQNQIIMVEVN